MGEIIQQYWLDISTKNLPWDELHLDPSFFPIIVIRVISGKFLIFPIPRLSA